jgi:hypothetical protein
VWFEASAHMPHYEEPARFGDALRAALDRQNVDPKTTLGAARTEGDRRSPGSGILRLT